MIARFQLYQDEKGEFRWRLRANNNKIIADSGEGYKKKNDCLEGIFLAKKLIEKVYFEDETGLN